MQLKDLQPRLVGLLQAGAFLTAIFSLATLADHLHRYLELFSHFRLQYLVVAVILAVLLFVLQSRRWAIAMLLVAAVNAIPLSSWYVADARAPASASPTVRLLLSNVYSGNGNIGALVDLITTENADVVFLQELTGRRSEALTPLRETYTYSLNIPRDDNFGIAVLSKHPFASARVIESPPFGFPTLVVQLTVDSVMMTFVTTHPIPPLGKSGFDGRNEQLASIAELINSIGGPRVLIGDLNTTMWSHHYGQLLDETGLVNARHGFGVLPSWPTQLPFAMIPIDHCLLSEEFAVLDIRTGPDIGSDHRPLIVDLSLAAQ